MRRRAALVVVAVAAAALAACSSSRAGVGHGSAAAPRTTIRSANSSAPASPHTAATATATATATARRVTPCPQRVPPAVVSCLRGALSAYWSGQLNQVVREPIVLDAVPAEAPPSCRPGIEGGTPITCKRDLTLYVPHAFLALIKRFFHGVDVALALASVASHEIGHVLQFTLHQPQIEQRRPSDATSRVIEQQADCLSGVWAGQLAARHALDVRRFVTDAVKLIGLVSSNPEIATHGTPPARRAAIERGIAGANAGACHLVTVRR